MSRRKHRRVAVCGSRSFPLDAKIGKAVLDMLLAYPKGTVFITRGSPGFDSFIAEACPWLDVPCEIRPGAGGPLNFHRDAAMALECDELLAFLDPKSVPDENTGTAHVIEKFLDKHKRVLSYSVANGDLSYVGSMNE